MSYVHERGYLIMEHIFYRVYEGLPPEVALAMYEEDMEEIRRVQESYYEDIALPFDEEPIPTVDSKYVSDYIDTDMPF